MNDAGADPSGKDREFALDGCASGAGDSVADVGEDELLSGFGQ